MPGPGDWAAEGAAMQDWQSAVPMSGHQQDPMPMLQASWLAEVRTIGRFVHMLVWCNIRQRRSSAEKFKYSTLQLDL
jgi:hypothetical protein